ISDQLQNLGLSLGEIQRIENFDDLLQEIDQINVAPDSFLVNDQVFSSDVMEQTTISDQLQNLGLSLGEIQRIENFDDLLQEIDQIYTRVSFSSTSNITDLSSDPIFGNSPAGDFSGLVNL
ncbi:MAG: hypothetical protein AAGF26_09535, partial [Cyanobacteria bacterium P01_G01_bin.49]